MCEGTLENQVSDAASVAEQDNEVSEEKDDPYSSEVSARRFAQAYQLCLGGTGLVFVVYLTEGYVLGYTDWFVVFLAVTAAVILFLLSGVLFTTEEEVFSHLWIFSIAELLLFWWIVDPYLVEDTLVEQSITATFIFSIVRYIDGKIRKY